MDDYAYLAGLSAHPDRPGDTANFNPAFAHALAASIRQARAAGLPITLNSGFREPGQTGSAYDAGGNSSHTYGLASDVGGLDGPNGKITNQWAQIAEANGLHNPYGVGDKAEFNHWQLPGQPLEQTPALLASLKAAKATGNFQNVWNAYGDAGTKTAGVQPINPGLTVNTSPLAGSHAQFIQDYARSIGLNPNLALGIANAEGLKAWSAANPNAASTVDVENGKPFSFGDFQLNVHPGAMGAKALVAGIDPADPKQWQAADRFALDQMKAGGVGPWKGDPVAAAYLKSGAVPSSVDTSAPATPGTSLASLPAAAGASGVLPGFGTKQSSDQFLAGLKQMGITPPSDQPDQQQQNVKPSPIMSGPGLRNASSPGSIEMQARQLEPQLTGYQPSLYGSSINSQPLAWSNQALAAPSWMMRAGAQGGPQGMGTSLNSLQAMDPTAYQDRLAMLYGTSGGGYG